MEAAVPTEFDCLNFVDTPIFVVTTLRSGGYRMLFSNAAHERCTGLRASEISGRLVTEIFSTSQATLMSRNYDTALGQLRPYSYKEALRLSDGEHWFETTLVTMPRSPDGNFRIVGTSKDITTSTDRAIAARVARSEFESFLGVAAHDLRAPMRQVRSIAGLLREDFTDLGDGKVELIETLDRIGENSVRLVEDILTFVEADSLGAASEAVSLDKLCLQMLTLLDLDNAHSIEVTPAIVETDPLILQIILRNLIENSIKHGDGKEMSIRVEAMAETEDQFNLWYSDNGRGLEGRDVLGARTGGDYRQSGYGMATVRRLLQTRKGSIHVMPSRFGQGAGFALVLPGRLQLIG